MKEVFITLKIFFYIKFLNLRRHNDHYFVRSSPPKFPELIIR